MSQVEHTKKHNIIDYKRKSVKQNHADYQNHLTVCFNTLLWYCHALRKRFWLEQDALARSTDSPSICDHFNQMEECSKYSARVSHTNVSNNIVLLQEVLLKIKCYMYLSNHIFCVHYGDHCFLILIHPV